MTKYRVVYEDPDEPNEPAKVLIPTEEWMADAMDGKLPCISVYWALAEDEQLAIDEGRHKTFKHDPEKFAAQEDAPRIGKLTEEEAIEYLIMKDIPRRVWGQKHNRPMLRIVKAEQVPSDRMFRNAWRIAG